jgi:hypothetical protein
MQHGELERYLNRKIINYQLITISKYFGLRVATFAIFIHPQSIDD